MDFSCNQSNARGSLQVGSATEVTNNSLSTFSFHRTHLFYLDLLANKDNFIFV